MLTVNPSRLGSIQRASRALLVLFIFISVISLWGTYAVIAHPNPPDTRTLAGVEFHGEAVTAKIQGLWLAQMLLGAAVSLKILYHLIRLMVLYARGQLFTASSVAHLRQIGITYAAAVGVWLVPLIGAAPEIAAAQEQWVNILPSCPGGAIVGACLFLFASYLMDEGRKLREEQDLVV
jgi:hypothetical protein